MHKIVSDFGKCRKVVMFTAVLETGRRPDCEKRVVAPSPFLEGASAGPVMPGPITELYGVRCTDSAISHFLESFFGFKASETAIASARKAVSCALDRQLCLIQQAFPRCKFVQGDEAGIRIGIVGKVGTVWVFICKHVAFVATTRKGIPFLREHFGWLLHLPVVSDRNSSYNALADRQCWRHPLGHVEAPAVDGGAGDRARHEQAAGFHKIKRKTAAPLTVTELTREIRYTISAYPEGKAVPDMFTFLSYPGMPPHNNATELAVRDGPVRHRNVRHERRLSVQGRSRDAARPRMGHVQPRAAGAARLVCIRFARLRPVEAARKGSGAASDSGGCCLTAPDGPPDALRAAPVRLMRRTGG